MVDFFDADGWFRDGDNEAENDEDLFEEEHKKLKAQEWADGQVCVCVCVFEIGKCKYIFSNV